MPRSAVTVATFEIEIVDCVVDEIYQPTPQFEDVTVDFGEVVSYSFESITQTPDCEFDTTFTVTLIETSFDDDSHPEFSTEVEGITPDVSFVQLSNRQLIIEPKDKLLSGRAWSVYVNGNVVVNTTI